MTKKKSPKKKSQRRKKLLKIDMPKKSEINEHQIRVMISQTRLKKRVRELGKEISKK